jgi:hypothetical protein
MWDPREIGRLGGKARTERQRAAARANGTKGGRPPKIPKPDAPVSAWRKFKLYHVVKIATALSKSGANIVSFRRAFLPLLEESVRKELIRRGRRDLWNNLQSQLQMSSATMMARIIAEARLKRKNRS